MKRSSKPIAVGALIALMSTVALAEIKADSLLSVDQNRIEIVEGLVAKWKDHLVSGKEADLKKALMNLRADKLLAVSLAQDQKQFAALLEKDDFLPVRGEAAAVRAKALGDQNTDVVYVPLTPCRLFYTEIASGGAGGALLPGATRTFNTRGSLTGQGGAPGCEVPSSATAVVMQMGAFSSFGLGWINAGPQGSPIPSGVLLAYNNVAFINATSVVLKLNPTNGQFSAFSNNNRTELYGDVLGYFASPSNGNGLRVVQNIGGSPNSPNIINGSSTNVVTSTQGGTVSGGRENTAGGDYGTIGGGRQNSTGTFEATVAGGRGNQATGGVSAIGGGFANNAGGSGSTIAGGVGSTASGQGATVGGGGNIGDCVGRGASTVPCNNKAQADFATVAGGRGNTATAVHATVGGGDVNTAGGQGSVVAGGVSNFATGSYSVVDGGSINSAIGPWSTVAGGTFNFTAAGATYGAIGGGAENVVSGLGGTVPGGSLNVAGGDHSFAAGWRAINSYPGAFMWADRTNLDFKVQANEFTGAGTGWANAANTFNVRATGGVWFVTNVDTTTGRPTAGAFLNSGSGSWSSTSDRHAKVGFEGVNVKDVLRKVASLPINLWSYKTENGVRHIGPTAQDFKQLFGVGPDDRSIATVDADGVALAAIQGLHQVMREKDSEIAVLKRKLRAIEKKLGL